MQQKVPCVYIMASRSGVIYIGVTSDLGGRVWQHKNADKPGSFTDRYHCNRLVWFEEFSRMDDAITYEKYLKGKKRAFKVGLIERSNPDWKDLAESWEA